MLEEMRLITFNMFDLNVFNICIVFYSIYYSLSIFILSTNKQKKHLKKKKKENLIKWQSERLLSTFPL